MQAELQDAQDVLARAPEGSWGAELTGALVSGVMEALLTDLGSGRLKPVIAKTFPLARAADAHKFIQDRANIGKVVLTV